MTAPGISLKSQGLRMDNLDCPSGGRHEIPLSAVVAAAARNPKGGTAACLRCKRVITLLPA